MDGHGVCAPWRRCQSLSRNGGLFASRTSRIFDVSSRALNGLAMNATGVRQQAQPPPPPPLQDHGAARGGGARSHGGGGAENRAETSPPGQVRSPQKCPRRSV